MPTGQALWGEPFPHTLRVDIPMPDIKKAFGFGGEKPYLHSFDARIRCIKKIRGVNEDRRHIVVYFFDEFCEDRVAQFWIALLAHFFEIFIDIFVRIQCNVESGSISLR